MNNKFEIFIQMQHSRTRKWNSYRDACLIKNEFSSLINPVAE